MRGDLEVRFGFGGRREAATESDCTRRVVAEFTGAGFLLATIVGFGIMGFRLAGGDALVLGPHALATGGILFVMIRAFGPMSGAHFNPAVTIAFMVRREIGRVEVLFYIAAQIVVGVVGVLLTHITFSESFWQISTTARGDSRSCWRRGWRPPAWSW